MDKENNNINKETTNVENNKSNKSNYEFIAPKKDLYGVFLEENQKIIIEK